jgi:hypothetical protein
VIDANTTRALQAVEAIGNVRFQAIILGTAKDTSGAGPTTKVRRDLLDISINLYGEPHLARSVGRSLTQRRKFLQHPNSVDAEIGYQNPHYLMVSGSNPDLSKNIGPLYHQEMSADEVSQGIGKIMESLDIVDADVDLPKKDNIRTSLLKYSNFFSHLHIDADFRKASGRCAEIHSLC